MCPLGACLCWLKMDVRKEIVNFFQKEGMLIQPEAVEYLVSRGNGIEECKNILKKLEEKPFILSVDMIREFFEKKEERKEEGKREKVRIEEEKIRKERLKILRDVTGNSTCEGTLDDFVRLFRSRFEKLSDFLRKRQEMKNAVPIKKALRSGEEIATIGIVKDVVSTPNGLFVEIEDEEESIRVYVPKNIDSMIVHDEVLGVVGKRKGEMFIARSIVRPEIPVERRKNFSSEEIYVAFLSDLHVGSKSFLEKEWDAFLEWIKGKKGNERQKSVAEKIKYIVISGDDIEGVGIYPGQERDLMVEDLYEQYELLAEKLSDIPPEIKILMQPGNHDAVRPALPQPAFEKEIKDLFSHLNITFIGNPCYMEIEGVLTLVYHGQSIQDFATCLPNMSQNQPTKIMKEMLKRRHMAPIYGGISSLAPEKEDYMVIDIVPDIFVTGHVHVTAIEQYRNVLLINASAWQSQTDYQRMMNFMPDPAKAVVVNLKNLIPSIIQFA